ncbi:hypothetical protein Goshw_027359 [Gossypium schwendimanii]|uniref:Zinc knuckle CX2CX4HX4C domain-containing protein n=1 Tax=Gossypium schwendimanii TaxID=34291 RepID=A0A7J9LYX7_GOSSC|nr:hypothetical protein [Gossypium schwendimanii]
MVSGGSWSFNNCFFFIHQLSKRRIQSILSSVMPIFGYMYMTCLLVSHHRAWRVMGNLMGKFLNYDTTNQCNNMNNYKRIQVRLNILTPFMRQQKLEKDGGEPPEASFSYEQLPLICYICETVGHGKLNSIKLIEFLK